MHAKSLQLCPTLHDPMDCSLPDSTVQGILQVRILEWIVIPSYRGSSLKGSNPCLLSPALVRGFFATSAPWKAQIYVYITKPLCCIPEVTQCCKSTGLQYKRKMLNKYKKYLKITISQGFLLFQTTHFIVKI